MPNQALDAAVQEYAAQAEAYLRTLGEHGVEFAPAGSSDERIADLRSKLAAKGANFRNAGASIQIGWLSKACVECTGNGGSETFSTTFKCHRDCYFCFNHNQPDYQEFFDKGCPWQKTLAESAATNGSIACVGLTGGEPLLNIDDTINFLEQARQTFPQAHMRMYTSGDLLDEDGARRLRDAGLREIRFSIKPDDPLTRQQRVLEAMELAKRHIPDLMVEMPTIPGTDDFMRQLFVQFDRIGIDGINLLEFCFPFHNWDEYAKRGFTVRNPPFDVMYDYGYSGGLPIAGSEELALELMLFALERNMDFGMHYCSLDNKHRSEMRQINEPGASMHPCFSFDEGDFFLKTACVFGPDCQPARQALAAAGCTDILESDGVLRFPLRYLGALGAGITPMVSLNVLEHHDGSRFLREVALQKP